MKEIIKMFGNGRWLNLYELPFFNNNNNYLESTRSHNWTAGDLEQSIGSLAADYAQHGLNINLPTQPIFKISDIGNSGMQNIKT
jgi:hypothetical protein